ncbi:MAG: hypothetical protein HC803_00380 [Saprospiraceae bacterium]|nr:hypothetical protein [Saprospiraceae bacterium]
MKQLSLIFALGILLFVASCTPGGKTGKTEEEIGIKFVEGETYEAIWKSTNRGKPIMIDFYTTWCAPCKWLEKDVFQLPHVCPIITTVIW